MVLLHPIEPMRHGSGFELPKACIEDVPPRFLAAGQALPDEAAGQ